jgi:replication factor C subunit 1
MKASSVVAPKRQAKEKPDLEEALDESDEAEVVEEVKDEEEEDADLSKDKYVKQPKKKRPGATKGAPGSKRGKKAKEEESDEEVATSKGKGKGKAVTKGKKK